MSAAADRIRAGLAEADAENAGTAWYGFVRRDDIQALLREVAQPEIPPHPSVIPHPSMSVDQLAELQVFKDAQLEANPEAVDEAYLLHEDFIARLDKVIANMDKSITQRGYLHTAEWTLWNQRLTALRDQLHDLLLGPVGPERDAPAEIG